MNKLTIALFSCVLLISTASAKSGTHTKTSTHTYSKNNCSSGYNSLKSQLKDTAKRHCVSTHGSSGLDILKNTNWTKIKCTKKKVKGKTTTVTVKGTFTNKCK